MGKKPAPLLRSQTLPARQMSPYRAELTQPPPRIALTPTPNPLLTDTLAQEVL